MCLIYFEYFLITSLIIIRSTDKINCHKITDYDMASKRMILMLDTSDTINLNHLDIIPFRTLNSLQSIVNLNIEKRQQTPVSCNENSNHSICSSLEDEYEEEAITKSSSRSKRIRNNSSKKCHSPESKLQPSHSNKRYDSDTVKATKYFLHKPTKLTSTSHEMEKFRKKEDIDHSEIPKNQDDFKQDDDGAVEQEDPDTILCVPPEICEKIVQQIRQLGTIAGIGKLNQALKELESSLSGDSSMETSDVLAIKNSKLWNYKQPHHHHRTADEVSTIFSTKIEPFTSSNCSVVPENNIRNLITSKKYPRKKVEQIFRQRFQPTSQSDAIIFISETHGDNFRSQETPSKIMTDPEGFAFESPIPALSQQKAADIWNWVSPKYSPIPEEFDLFCRQSRSRSRSTRAVNNSIFPSQNGHDTYLTVASFNNETKNQEFLQKQQENHPKRIFSKCTVQTDLFSNQLKSIQGNARRQNKAIQQCFDRDLTPSCTSSNLSPLYEVFTECLDTIHPDDMSNKQVNSACSLTPLVFSMASLADVQSGGDDTRCSTASTITEFEYHEKDKAIASSRGQDICTSAYLKCVENLTGITNQKLVTILGEFNRLEAQKRKTYQSVAAAVPSKTNTFQDSSNTMAPLETVINQIDSKCFTKELRGKTKEATPQLESTKSSAALIVRRSASGVKKLKRKMDKNKTKKNDSKKTKNEGELESSGDEQNNKENRRKSKKNKAITLINHLKKKKGCLTDGKEGAVNCQNSILPIQKLKNSLPRTNDGRFAFSNKKAEKAIADYVRAELAATLELEAKLKSGKLRNLLCSFIQQNNGEKQCLNNNCTDNCSNKGPSCRHKTDNRLRSKIITGVGNANQSPLAKKKFSPVTLHPKKSLQEQSTNHYRPKQSNRINFIRYQQQSIAAMLNISRSRMNKNPGYCRPVPLKPPISKGLIELGVKKKKEILNGNGKRQIKSNRNAVTVVFGNE